MEKKFMKAVSKCKARIVSICLHRTKDLIEA